MNKKYFILFLLGIFQFSNTKAQEITDYYFTWDRCKYISIDEPVLPFSGGCQERGYYNSIPIGFNFPYLGKTYKRLSASVQGFIVLGQDLRQSTNYFDDLQDAEARPVIAPLWDDDINIEKGSFLYETRGSAPNRIFIAQWQNVSLDSDRTPQASFQVWLYENGRIEYHYKHETEEEPRSLRISIGIAAEERDTFLELDDASQNPVLRTTRDFGTRYINTRPPNNHVYVFNPIDTSERVINFEFESYQETYEEIQSNFSIPIVNYPEVNGTLDEGVYNNLSIGFKFSFEGVNYTTFSASTNGWLTLGQDIDAPAPGNLLQSGGNRPVIAPLWDDLSLDEGSFSYLTTGSTPHRILTIQWDSVKWWHQVEKPNISFQVKLYESDGRVEFIYKRLGDDIDNNFPASDNSASIGISGSTAGEGSFQSLGGWIYFPEVSTETEVRNFRLFPPDQYVYSFYLDYNFLVTNTNDSGRGSLRDAIEDSNFFYWRDRPEKTFIRFNISEPPPWIINLDSALDEIESPVIIDGTTQPNWSEENMIIIDGDDIQDKDVHSNRGLLVSFDSSEIYGLQLQNFKEYGILTSNSFPVDILTIGKPNKGNRIIGSETGIFLQGVLRSTIENNYIGVDETGNSPTEEMSVGINANGSDQNTIKGNIISGCSDVGISLFGSLNTNITDNRIGTDVSGINAIPNQLGIRLSNGSNFNTIEGNIISGNTISAIITETFSTQNKLYNNLIGVNTRLEPLPNGGNAIELNSGKNQIGKLAEDKGNIIAYNQGHGVKISSNFNTLQGNQIYCNERQGIELINNSNEGIQPPTIELVLLTKVEGKAQPNQTIEVFTDNSCNSNQGSRYIGNTTSNENGDWELVFPFNREDKVTATATNTSGSTSMFSNSVGVTPPPIITSFQPSNGGFGTEVRISGENLSTTFEVIFADSERAEFEVLDDNTIITQVPEGAKTGIINLQTLADLTNSGGFFCVLPTKPTNLEVTNVFPAEISLKWNNNQNNSTSILIERSDGDDVNFRLIDEVVAGITEYTDRNNLIPDVTYFYRVQAKNDCNFEVLEFSNQIGATVFDIVTDNRSLYEKIGVQLYPNPAQNFIAIENKSGFSKANKGYLINAIGKIVWTSESQAINTKNWDIDTSLLTEGVYIFQYIENEKIYHEKVLIQR